jgi:hypothetical protein
VSPLPAITRLLFLDFDGVLHPGLAGTFCYLFRIEEFLLAHPAVGVVLSTSWRQQYSLDELRLYFSPALRVRIIDVTPVLPEGRGQRYAEIQAWLARHGGHLRWAALDDDASLFPAWCDELVLCDPARGLRQKHLDELVIKLA